MKNENLARIARECDVFLLDMDGTVYLGERPIGDMQNTLQKLRGAGKSIVYLTNNSSKSAEEYIRKLDRLHFWDERDSVYTSGMAAAEYLKETHAGKRVYLVGTEALREEFLRAGIALCEESPDVCVLAYDTALTFEKIRKFNEFLVKGAFYVATHPDAVCPADGVSWPDVGSFLKLFETSSKRLPDVICGKPYTVMGDCVRRKLYAHKERIVMVGDRLNTDIRFGVNNGFRTLLVLSGEATAEQAETSCDRAEAVAESLNEIAEYL